MTSVLGDPDAYEGVYFELRDGTGEILFVFARSGRTGDGWSYTDPALGLGYLRAIPQFGD